MTEKRDVSENRPGDGTGKDAGPGMNPVAGSDRRRKGKWLKSHQAFWQLIR